MLSPRAPRVPAFVVAVAAVAAAGLASCQQAVTLAKIGAVCAADSDCGSGLCSKLDKVCTRSCGKQLDCPVGFDCGLAHLDDGKPGGAGATCYKANYTNPASGGYGTDCSAYSTDPGAADVHCDSGAANPCADGFTCVGAVKCDPTSICTKECASDGDCPPTFFCAVETARNCTKDGDCDATLGQTCQATSAAAGAAKICTGKKWCRPRTQCSPCGPSDQCPLGYACAVDASGERFCGKSCSSDDQCPWPVRGGSAFMGCVDSQDSAGKVCRPLQGSCHGVSNLDGVAPGGQCSSCRPGIPSDCPGSYCLTLQSLETLCTQPCTIEVKKGTSGYSKVANSDKGCSSGQPCVVSAVPKDCGTGCTAPGVCAVDQSGMDLTCFP